MCWLTSKSEAVCARQFRSARARTVALDTLPRDVTYYVVGVLGFVLERCGLAIAVSWSVF